MNCRYRQSAKKFSAKEHRPSKVPPSDRASVPVERHASADFVLMISIAQGQAGGSARLLQAHLKSLAKPAVVLPRSMVGIEISTQLPRQRLWRPAGMVGHAEQAENHAMFLQYLATDAMPRSALQPPAGQP